MKLGALPGAAPALALPGMGDVVPTRSLIGRVPGLARRALTPRAVCGLADACALVGSFHAPPSVPVAVFGPLLGPSGSLALFWPPLVPQ